MTPISGGFFMAPPSWLSECPLRSWNSVCNLPWNLWKNLPSGSEGCLPWRHLREMQGCTWLFTPGVKASFTQMKQITTEDADSECDERQDGFHTNPLLAFWIRQGFEICPQSALESVEKTFPPGVKAACPGGSSRSSRLLPDELIGAGRSRAQPAASGSLCWRFRLLASFGHGAPCPYVPSCPSNIRVRHPSPGVNTAPDHV